jgi:hypothetical protein
MDESSLSDADGLFPSPTFASILGVKGFLRLRPHGSSQKAHVVLRRVEFSDDSGDDEEGRPIAYYSLFAQKRIEVKPGKEILMAVASSDTRFKDQALIFEGDLSSGNESSEEEDVGDVVEEDIPDSQFTAGQAIPPKMRRAWTKRFEDVSPMTRECVASFCFYPQPTPIYVFQMMYPNPVRHTDRWGCK